jgi:diaminopimelate epimerase
VKFVKAHGAANDFIIVGEADLPEAWPDWARRVCDRNRGIGADGVLVVAIDAAQVRARMRLLNPDGTDGDISGNGVRCVAAWAFAEGLLPSEHTVAPPPGDRPVRVTRRGARSFEVETNLGIPRLAARDVPTLLPAGPDGRVIQTPLEFPDGSVRVTCCSLGNPHAALFLDQSDRENAEATMIRLGPVIERHPAFPRRTNVEFVSSISRREFGVRFWERGVGPTMASGTGSASAFIASVMTGRCDRDAVALCPGGKIRMRWDHDDAPLIQWGPVEIVFEGQIEG